MTEHKIFGTKYFVFKDEMYRELRKDMIQFMYDLKDEYPDSVSKSNSGGWQSGNFNPTFKPALFEGAVGSHLSDFVKTSVASITKEIFIPEISGAWININKKDSYNEVHTHPNSSLSAVYYVKVPDGSGRLQFVDERQKQLPINHMLTEPLTSFAEYVYPWEGTLVVFSADQPHSVETNQTEHDRISIAFNVELKLNTNGIM